MRTLVILGLAYILFIHGLGSISLWDPDEPRQAIMAREMVERGDYVHPYLNGTPYLEKPPLYPWLIVLTSKITGRIDEFSSRLPSALAATLLLLLMYFLGKRLDHEVSGFLSALILAANFQFLGNARESVMDMTFAFFIGLAIFLGYLSIDKGKKGLLTLALLPSALAILSKGPAGFVIPVVVLFFYSIATRRLKAMFVPLAVGSLLALALSSVWFLLAGKAYFNEFILHQNINRFTTGFDHVEPFTYYFSKLFTNFLPWSIALPFAAFFAYRRRLWLPLIWLVFVFFFFDASRSKRAIYLLSCYPACALLVGIYLKEQWYLLVQKGWTTAILSLFALALLALPALLFPAIRRVPLLGDMVGKDLFFVAMLVVIFGSSGLAFLLSILQKAPGKGFLALFIYLVCLGFLYHSLYLPAVDREQKSARLIVEKMHGAEKTHPVYMYGFNSPALIFYVGKPVPVLRDAADLPAEKDDIMVVVEDTGDNTEPFKKLFPRAQGARYEKTNYVIFTGANGT